MRYKDFEHIISTPRINRYLIACNGNSRKAMTLYRKNLQLSQELFTIISCFEIALRNAIDNHVIQTLGRDWLRTASSTGGIFDNANCFITAQTINDEIYKLNQQYTHAKLVAELGFGFWRYLFSAHHYRATGQNLLQIFNSKPRSSATIQYNSSYIFNELAKINNLRNRIAHHEPVCFVPGYPVKDTSFVRQHYNLILQLFRWLSIDEAALLYGLDHILTVCNEIDSL
ncbi:MAG: Abi family protein [Niastella sp.]|nr:Abi family protein [Niastella sp.]